jgi:hypothetical protein
MDPMLSRLNLRAAGLALALFASAGAAAAQQCVGIPSQGNGFLTYGFEGTDGATGDGVSFAYGTPNAAVLLQRRSMDGFTLVDDLASTEAQLSIRLPAIGLPVCLVAGGQWTAYDNEREQSRSWTDPGYVDQRNRIGGPYERVRVPVGISAGEEFRVGRVALAPFVTPTLVYESETYRPFDGGAQRRTDWGYGVSGGVTATVGWLVVRPTLSHVSTHEYALSSQHNWPIASLQLGVRF